MKQFRNYEIIILLTLMGSVSFNHSIVAVGLNEYSIEPSWDQVEGTNLVTTDYNNETFVSRWDTTATSTGSTDSHKVKLPLESSGNYNFVVDWGDGDNNTITSWDQAEVTHTYASEGVYNMTIDGTLVGWRFNDSGDKRKIIEISQWGNLRLGNSDSYFYGAKSLWITANDALNLTGTTTLYQAFKESEHIGQGEGNFNDWNVSGVTNMRHMFYNAYVFNRPLANWDVSSVTDMEKMFYNVQHFDQPLGDWNVSSVTNMERMLYPYIDLSVANYDNLLAGWAALPLQEGVSFHAGNSICSDFASRQYIVDTFGWTITDGWGVLELETSSDISSEKSSDTTESNFLQFSIIIISIVFIPIIQRFRKNRFTS